MGPRLVTDPGQVARGLWPAIPALTSTAHTSVGMYRTSASSRESGANNIGADSTGLFSAKRNQDQESRSRGDRPHVPSVVLLFGSKRKWPVTVDLEDTPDRHLFGHCSYF